MIQPHTEWVYLGNLQAEDRQGVVYISSPQSTEKHVVPPGAAGLMVAHVLLQHFLQRRAPSAQVPLKT